MNLVAIDWRNPPYDKIAAARLESLLRLRAAGEKAERGLKAYYRDHVADFIDDWGVTYDPRNIEVGRSPIVPFVLFPRQREFVDWVIEHWRGQKPGITEKSRDGGMSWLCVAVACALCLFHDGMKIGFGSRKEEYVDKIDEPKSLFWKARFFMRHLPEELRGGWREGVDSPYMRIKFPQTGSYISGEAGDDIGRGDRTGIYFVDEAAHIPRPGLVDMALSQTTNCRIDVSSVNGPNNSFAVRRHSGKVDVFIWDWRDDPRKDEAWYAKQVAELDPIVVAQEIDRDYSAAVEGVVIPGAWIKASLDAAENLGMAPAGETVLAFDVADGGADRNAIAAGQGIRIDRVEEWAGGKGEHGDIFRSVERVFEICDEMGIGGFRYDADGLGAGVRGDARVINDRRKLQGLPPLGVDAYRGSAELIDPEGEDVKGRLNENMFANRKAQEWWRLRTRFQKTYRRVVEGVECPPDEMISISTKCGNWAKLCAELGQPQYETNAVGKLLIRKKPDGMKSPNMADAVVIKAAKMAPSTVRVPPELLRRIQRGGPRLIRASYRAHGSLR